MPTELLRGRDPAPVDILTGLELWSIVGDEDALADSSDSTYVQAGQNWTSPPLTVTGPRTQVTLDPASMDEIGAGDVWESLTIRLRFRQTVNTRVGVGPPEFQLQLYNDVGFSAFVDPLPPLIDDADVHDYVWGPWTPEDNGFGFGWPAGLFINPPVYLSVAQTADYLAGPGTGATQHRIYEASVEIEWAPAVTCLMNAERSSCIHIKQPAGDWADFHLVGS